MANNEEKFDKITDINYAKPVEGGYGATFGSVIGRINKIIRTFIDKFKETDNAIAFARTDFAGDIQGIKGITDTFPSTAIALNDSNKRKSITLTIPVKRKYNFGWIVLLDSSNNQITKVPLPWSANLANTVYSGYFGGTYAQISNKQSLNSIRASAYIEASSTANSVTIKVDFVLNDYTSSAEIPANSYKIKYELY